LTNEEEVFPTQHGREISMKQLLIHLTIVILALNAMSMTAEAEDILAFGDSITRGSNDSSGSDYGGYPLVLQQMYENAGLAVYVYNYGVSGEQASIGVNRIGGVVGRGGEYILIQEGNNDIIQGHSVQTLRNNLSIMIDKSRAAGVEPVLSTLTPDTKHGLLEYINGTVNPEIVALATEKGVRLVDNYGAVVDSWAAWSFDGLHPNYDGMYAIAANYYASLPIAGSGGGTASSGSGDGGGGGCFIATAAYGSLIEPQVTLLRRFRDSVLSRSNLGQGFIRLYYHYSPNLAAYIQVHPRLQGPVRLALYPLVGMSFLLVNGYGWLTILFILLLLGTGLLLKRRWAARAGSWTVCPETT
jgi:lysophospholipase L1-like esterase